MILEVLYSTLALDLYGESKITNLSKEVHLAIQSAMD